MFHPSPQNTFLTQQVISTNQSYPCPRCPQGVMEPYGLTETFQCIGCNREFVALKNGHLLYPARDIGFKIAPIYWWDGLRWHWAGTTASAYQILAMAILSLLPALALNIAFYLNLWTSKPGWCTPELLTPLVGLLTIQLVYLICWDFNVSYKSTRKRIQKHS